MLDNILFVIHILGFYTSTFILSSSKLASNHFSPRLIFKVKAGSHNYAVQESAGLLFKKPK